jgi:hypothetical protein
VIVVVFLIFEVLQLLLRPVGEQARRGRRLRTSFSPAAKNTGLSDAFLNAMLSMSCGRPAIGAAR